MSLLVYDADGVCCMKWESIMAIEALHSLVSTAGFFGVEVFY
jgi:hypothetical protein